MDGEGSAKYKEVKEELESEKKPKGGRDLIKEAKDEFEFSKKYSDMDNDLNEKLITYIDLKYKQIWSNDFCRKIKWQMKEASVYFRLVKQGSIVVYLSCHVFTILFILLMAVLRQSLISLGYVLLILPRLKDGADVLRQNLLGQNKAEIELNNDVKKLKQDIQIASDEIDQNNQLKEEAEKQG